MVSALPAHLHPAFLVLLPKIETHARIYFRGIPSERKADLIAETVGVACKWYVRLREQGKDPAAFPVAFTTLAAKAVACGRRVNSQEKARDAMSPVAQRRHGFKVEALPVSTQRS